jgi:hypothetical protein
MDLIAACWQSATEPLIHHELLTPKKDSAENSTISPISHHMGGTMVFAQECSGHSSVAPRPSDPLTLGLIGMGVIFASLGLGEAVFVAT